MGSFKPDAKTHALTKEQFSMLEEIHFAALIVAILLDSIPSPS